MQTKLILITALISIAMIALSWYVPVRTTSNLIGDTELIFDKNNPSGPPTVTHYTEQIRNFGFPLVFKTVYAIKKLGAAQKTEINYKNLTIDLVSVFFVLSLISYLTGIKLK